VRRVYKGVAAATRGAFAPRARTASLHDMDTEQQMAEARAYVAALRSGVAPLAPDVRADPPRAQPVPVAISADAAIGREELVLELAPGSLGLELGSPAGTVFGRLTPASGGDRWADTADGRWRLAFQRTRKSWMILAQSEHDDAPVAAYHPGWRPGGDVWVAPDDWWELRWTPLTREPSWRLTSAGTEIVRLRRNDDDRIEIAVEGACARPALLVLLLCHVVMLETVPLEALVLGRGGGVELGLDDWS
jgi:hypothetical protein